MLSTVTKIKDSLHVEERHRPVSHTLASRMRGDCQSNFKKEEYELYAKHSMAEASLLSHLAS